ncbi:palmitoyltransferase AKR1 isoform X2 [Exaiptasia diaphana]|uniref:Palmitoyltransferase n=1 Tax=Exaiptasia diaphana TaxID=2652724 RepID=A0A913YAN8_EXADI|nr:palmitoyltransferase AKR1 isoform X2 [Exaiptasia diaphana]
MALFDVISHDNVGDCKYILERDPSLVHSVGWHGMTPLHRAATRGNLEILQILLEFGANVNALNGFGETPLHFACQTASLKFVGILVNKGADIKVIDNGGRSSVHHAARSGSVWKIHYFVTLGLDLHKRDSRGQTVLHIAAECGHIDLIQYCLRNKRFDPGITDNSMMTPLHFAVQSKNRQCAWLVESSSHKSLVLLPDIHGSTPVDYAAKGNTMDHRWLQTHLKYWNASRFAGYRPKPWLPWLLLLMSPSLLICLIVYCVKEYSYVGWPLAIVLFATFYAWAFTSHRIRHVSGFPNPAFAGLFFGVILQSLVCYTVDLAPRLWPELFWNTIALFVFVILLWEIKKLYSDPGRLKTSRLKDDGQPYTIIDIANGLLSSDDFCTDCEIVTQPFTKHCKLCNHCVVAIDHHCLFLMWCVALNNHRHFVMFMIQVLASQCLFIRASSTYLYSLVQLNGKYPTSFREAMGQEVYISSLFLLNCFGFFWVLMLTIFQFKVVSEGATTFYTPEGSQKYSMSMREMFSFGRVAFLHRLRNFFLFLIGDYSFYKNKQWEQSV